MPKKILIIDDNEVDRYLIQEMFKHTGMQADFYESSSGEKGLKHVIDINPDVVILDTHLPQMEGFEVCRMIKQNPALNTKVIMMTGQTDAVDTKKARDMGADDHCAKTADFQELMDLLKKII